MLDYKEVVRKMRAKYQNISLHSDLIDSIDEYIKKSKKGYRSRAEVVSDAVRRLIEGLK